MKELLVKVVVIMKKTKEGKKFPTYRCVTSKNYWYDIKFTSNCNNKAINKTTIIRVEKKDEKDWFFDYKKDKEGYYIKDKEGKKIPEIVVNTDYEIIPFEEAPDYFKYDNKNNELLDTI